MKIHILNIVNLEYNINPHNLKYIYIKYSSRSPKETDAS